MPPKLTPEAQNRADTLSNWLGQQQVDYAQPVQLQGILLNLVGEVQKLNRDKDTSKGARRVIDSILNAISLFGLGSTAAAQLGIDDLNHVAMSLVAKLDQQSYLLPADLTALSDRIQDVRQKLQNALGVAGPVAPPTVNTAANMGPTNPELQALQAIETKLENLVEKGKQVGPAIDLAIISVNVRDPYVFNYTERGQAKSQTYPTLYDLAAEVVNFENDAEFKKLVQVAGDQKTSLLANPFIDSAQKWGDEIGKLKREAVGKIDLIFQADSVALDVAAARGALSGPTIKFDGSLNLLAQTNTLEAAITTMKAANFPAGSAALRDTELNLSEPLLKKAKLSEWLRNLSTTSQKLYKLSDEVKKYPVGWPTSWAERAALLKQLKLDAAPERTTLSSEQLDYFKTNFDSLVDDLDKEIQREINVEGNNMSSTKYQYEAERAILEALNDWELVETILNGPSKVHIEEHGGIDSSRPLEKAAYDVLSERIFTDPEKKRTEPGYRSTDVDGDENFDKWLLARGRMSLRAFRRKFVDSGAARSNVGLWKTEAPQSASELTMFGFLMNRGPLMLETYHHPVVGPFLTELMERMLAQGSLRKGVIAVRDPADGRYYAKRHIDLSTLNQADIDSGKILIPDEEFNYDKMHQPSNGISKYLTEKVEELITKLQPQFNLDAFYLGTIKEMAISIFCDFNYVDVISSSAQERTQTPISPRTALVSSIEAVQNLAANVAHTLLRYRAERKSQNWFAPMIDYGPRLDAIGPHVGDSDEKHHHDIELLKEVIHKITTFYSIHFESSVFHRAGTPEKLGKVKMAALGHSQGVPNMHETLMLKSSKETIGRDKVVVQYDYDKYIMTLSMWSKFLDAVIEGMPENMTVEDVEKSSDNKGIIDTLITKILAVAKLTPGTHYDMVPIMLYTVSQRILARFVDHRDRMQVLGYMKRRFTEACDKGQGLDAFAPQMKPFLKMFGVGTLDADDRAALTYEGYHKDFAPVKDYDQRKRVHEYLVSEWNEKHPGVPAPTVVNLRRPNWIDWKIYKLATGDLTKAAEEFYHQLEHLSPESPADRVGIKDDAKK